jgi:rhodanese-related sulfurtransferase
MDPEEFQEKYGADKPKKDADFVFSCLAGGRSRKAMAAAKELGFEKFVF